MSTPVAVPSPQLPPWSRDPAVSPGRACCMLRLCLCCAAKQGVCAGVVRRGLLPLAPAVCALLLTAPCLPLPRSAAEGCWGPEGHRGGGAQEGLWVWAAARPSHGLSLRGTGSDEHGWRRGSGFSRRRGAELHSGSPQRRGETPAAGSGFGSLTRRSHQEWGWAAGTAFALQIPSPCLVCHHLPWEGRAPPLPGHCQGLSKAVCVQNVLGVFGGGWQSCCTIWVRSGTE